MGTVQVDVKAAITGRAELNAWQHALADAHREAKRTREQARYLDKKLAALEDATYALLGIEATRQNRSSRD